MERSSWAEARPGGQFGGLFRGWVLPAAVIATTPPLAILFWLVATQYEGSVLAFARAFSVEELLARWPRPSGWALGLLAGWTAVQALLLKVLPGREHLGPPTPAGERPRYKLNGVAAFLLTHAGLWFGDRAGLFDLSVVYDRFGELLWTSSLLALGICALLYLKGKVAPTGRDCSFSPNPVWDYWNGVELHPAVLGMQLKQLINCRVSMMAWGALLLCWADKNVAIHGSLGLAMATSVGLQLVYIFKFFWWEDGYFGSLDITHDRFGYYLFWGLMAWLPSLYTLASLCLVLPADALSVPAAIGIWAFGLGSIAVNYAADRQRMVVRQSGGTAKVWGRDAVLIEASYTTEDGERRTNLLLASGWWGISRHFHYVAELALAAAWTLPAGFSRLLPWAYVIFLAILLTDRARRDERRCAAKYGEDWTRYRAAVRWRMIPGIY